MLDCAVPLANTLCKYVEVVAVKMHGMRDRNGILYNNTHGAVGTIVVDVPLGIVRVGGVAFVCKKKDRVTWDD